MAATTTNADTSPASSGSVDTLLLSWSGTFRAEGVSAWALAWTGLLLAVICVVDLRLLRALVDSGAPLVAAAVDVGWSVLRWMLLVGSWVLDGGSVVGFTVVTAVSLITGDASETFRLSVTFPEKLTFSAGADEFTNITVVVSVCGVGSVLLVMLVEDCV